MTAAVVTTYYQVSFWSLYAGDIESLKAMDLRTLLLTPWEDANGR